MVLAGYCLTLPGSEESERCWIAHQHYGDTKVTITFHSCASLMHRSTDHALKVVCGLAQIDQVRPDTTPSS